MLQLIKESISTKIWSETRVSTFSPPFFFFNISVTSWLEKYDERNERYKQKQRSQFTHVYRQDDHIYKSTNDSTTALLELTNTFSKVAGY